MCWQPGVLHEPCLERPHIQLGRNRRWEREGKMGGEIGREGKAKCEGHKIGKGRRSKGKEEDDPTNIGNKLTLLMFTIQTPNHK